MFPEQPSEMNLRLVARPQEAKHGFLLCSGERLTLANLVLELPRRHGDFSLPLRSFPAIILLVN
jgi:hypothetical protein